MTTRNVGGGGGGWFGGGGGATLATSEGEEVVAGGPRSGGSGSIDPSATNQSMQIGVNSGNGKIVITCTVPPTTPHITTTSLPPGKVGVPYSFQLQAIGGTPPYTWNTHGPVGSGVLPVRLTLFRTGLISGVPKRAGSFTFTVKCLDSSRTHKTLAVATFTLAISP